MGRLTPAERARPRSRMVESAGVRQVAKIVERAARAEYPAPGWPARIRPVPPIPRHRRNDHEPGGRVPGAAHGLVVGPRSTRPSRGRATPRWAHVATGGSRVGDGNQPVGTRAREAWEGPGGADSPAAGTFFDMCLPRLPARAASALPRGSRAGLAVSGGRVAGADRPPSARRPEGRACRYSSSARFGYGSASS